MKQFKKLNKLKVGDKVVVISPSFAAPAIYREIYNICLDRLRGFGFIPIEYKTTSELNASTIDRANDIIKAFEDNEIKAIFATIGGDDQVTYIKNLPREPFINNPKPFFGYSDNSHLINHLWDCGVPAFYGCCLYSQLGTPLRIDDFTLEFLEKAFFESGFVELKKSDKIVDQSRTADGYDWAHGEKYLNSELVWEENLDWDWSDGECKNVEGVLWGGCVESIDELLRHRIPIPIVDDWENILLYLESSEEIPSHAYVRRVIRAFGQLGYLDKVKGVLIGRPMGSNFEVNPTITEKQNYRILQYKTILNEVREYNKKCPVVGNLDFGHTKPQFCIPSGKTCKIDCIKKSILLEY